MSAPRFAQRPDRNQPEIVSALEKAGCSVYDMSRVGGGFPDIIVGRAGKCFLLEIKSAKGKLRKSQIDFQMSWRGHFAVVRSPAEALKAVGLTDG